MQQYSMWQSHLGGNVTSHSCGRCLAKAEFFRSCKTAQARRQVVLVRAQEGPIKRGKSLDLGGSARDDPALQGGPQPPPQRPQRQNGAPQRPNQGPPRPRQNQGQQRRPQGNNNRPYNSNNNNNRPYNSSNNNSNNGNTRPRPPGRNFDQARDPGQRLGPRQEVQEPEGRPGRSSPDQPLMNSDIGCKEVRVLSLKKEQLGVMPTFQAQAMAEEEDIDMVMINPDVDPPLVRLIPLDKLQYEQAKQEKDQRKKQRENRQDLKEMRFRPNTEEHDYNTRLRNARKHLSKGDKVKLTMRFKGRERDFKNLGEEMFERFVDDLGEEAQVSERSRFQGNQMSLVLSPIKK